MSKTETVRVCVRTRPSPSFAEENVKIDLENQTIQVHQPKTKNQIINNQQEDWSFKFDSVLHNATQEQVYDQCAKDVVDSVLEGYNGTLIAFGQTGAGKTFTMTGGSQNYKYRGLIPRAITHIFRAIQDRPDAAVIVRISYLEIYNESLYDLLDEKGGQDKDLSIFEDARGQVTVKGCTRVVAENEETALNLLFQGEINRAIAEHEMNKSSTRSHCIFTVYLEMRSRVESSEKVVTSKLNLVDLAGSERVGKTGSSGVTLQEAKYINKSLSFLEQVVIALASKSRDHVPFRSSKLTHVLRDSLGGNCMTRMVANVWTEKVHLEETISTLKFATRMMRISNEATVNVQLDPMLLIKKYQKEIKDLKAELTMQDALANRGNIKYDAYTPEEQDEVRGTIQKYLKGELPDIEVVSVRQVQEVFRQFKHLTLELQQLLASGHRIEHLHPETQRRESQASARVSEKVPFVEEVKVELVGDLEDSKMGFHVGLAPPDARPTHRDAILASKKGSKRPEERKSASHPPLSGGAPHIEASPSTGNPGLVKRASSGVGGKSRVDEATAFEEYKIGAGEQLNEAFVHNKNELKIKKQQLKHLSAQLNHVKKDIDALNEQIQAKREQRQVNGGDEDEGVEVMDEEEYSLVRQCKDKKREYQDLKGRREDVTRQVTYLKNLVEQSKLVLGRSFLAWYHSTYQEQESQHGRQEDPELQTLDEGERFERLEMQRVAEEDPDSLPFYIAKKNSMQQMKNAKKQRSLASTKLKPLRF